ncbi:MAG: ATP-binding protein [Candidatus Bathyarchaeota archaeon]|nr:ATP-binding protein [Candidatus Bathyarchaeota archaeon]
MEIILIHLMLAILASVLSIYMILTRQHTGARIMTLLTLGASLWVYGYALEMFYNSYEAKLFWAKFQFIGMGVTSIIPLFTLFYYQKDRLINKKNVILLLIVPISMVGLAFTNEQHHLVFKKIAMNFFVEYEPLIKTNGLALTFFLLYTYTLILGSCIYAISQIREARSQSVKLEALMIGGLLLPTCLSFYMNFIGTTRLIDYTPMAFSIFCITMIIYAPQEIRLGNILPVAYASIINGMNDLVVLTNLQGMILHLNPVASEVFSKESGIKPMNLVGKSIEQVLPNMNRNNVAQLTNDAEVKFGEHYYDVSEFKLPNWKGVPSTEVIVLRNISERVKVEGSLQILHDHATEVSQAGNFDKIGEITYQAMYDSLDFQAGFLALKQDNGLEILRTWGVSEEYLEGCMNTTLCAKVTEPGSEIMDLKDLHCYREELGYNFMLMVPVISVNDVLGVIVILADEETAFTAKEQMLLEIFSNHVASAIARIQHESELKELQKAEINQVLEGANRVASMVRHDLRGPLQTIKNASFLIKLDSQNVETMSPVIDKTLDYMVKVVEGLKYSGDADSLTPVNMDLNMLVENSLKQIIIPEDISVKTRFKDVELVHPFDKTRIHRVLDNLIRNAIDAMPEGGELIVSTERTEGLIRLVVEDTGEGIEDVSQLFKPFRTTKKNGMGLGLISCKHAVEAHGGWITVESEVGIGTRFIIDFPVDTPHIGTSATNVSAIMEK